MSENKMLATLTDNTIPHDAVRIKNGNNIKYRYMTKFCYINYLSML